ncbi:hypothetical protein M231_04271 [Tremella mesenterica]|uniref:Inositolphosphorylceramide synthase subunit Kei1-domain-containing protein n=1 Tax=Tremella mesenterica TaxID=5217 RepID=A0A4Q1BL48_TREME|nr:uncharacterized protein TREMEDRAFT_70402 [Tremella mesenterica DSM 1558]EIW65733.1 hypothetical protein TREMEDRAFT_70402 [Tremella mesenterica DSM 1558]RXK38505.1 hypothetical protein M231_04271 [Tremella mesenterica]
MRIGFRPLRPEAVFSSFLGLLDIKLGSEIILLFGLINKVAGLYGLITIFVGGSFLQLLFYAYSTATLFAFLWALRIVKSETAVPTLLISHLYTIDHAILTIFHYLFYQHYWYSVPHDGRRVSNSQAQQDLINLAASRGEIEDPALTQDDPATEELRAALAGEIWQTEKVFAGWTLIAGWLLKIYFILILYSYAAHLRSSTYHTLPSTARAKATQIAHPNTEHDGQIEMGHDVDHNGSNGQAGNGSAVAGKHPQGEDEFSWD